MKTKQLIRTVLITVSFAVLLIMNPFKAFSQVKGSNTNSIFPEDVSNILHNSCAGCHGDGGKEMAMTMWNFDKWGTYSAGKQAKKAKEIYKAMKKEKMPPVSYKKSNPGTAPTKEQIEIINKWADALPKK